MPFNGFSRRGLFAGLLALAGGVFAYRWAGARDDGRTPGATEGPFYPTPAMRKPDTDNDLVKVEGLVREAKGEIVHVSGTIKDRNGAPKSGIRIEIWQCDMNGKYMHPGDDRRLKHDEGFQGFGHDVTDEQGRYRFRTIKPVIYPGRTPHIHVKVLDGSRELLTTQFYLKDHPKNAIDSLYRSMTRRQANSVSMDFVTGEDGPEATVDILV